MNCTGLLREACSSRHGFNASWELACVPSFDVDSWPQFFRQAALLTRSDWNFVIYGVVGTLFLFFSDGLLLATLWRQKCKGVFIYPFHVIMILMDLFLCVVCFSHGLWFSIWKPMETLLVCAYWPALWAFGSTYALNVGVYVASDALLLLAVADRVLALRRPLLYRNVISESRLHYKITLAIILSCLFVCLLAVPKTSHGLDLGGNLIQVDSPTAAVCALAKHAPHLLANKTFWWQNKGPEGGHLCVTVAPTSRDIVYLFLLTLDIGVLILSIGLVKELHLQSTRRSSLRKVSLAKPSQSLSRRRLPPLKEGKTQNYVEEEPCRNIRDKVIDCILLAEAFFSINLALLNAVGSASTVDLFWTNLLGSFLITGKFTINGLSMVLLSRDFRKEHFDMLSCR